MTAMKTFLNKALWGVMLAIVIAPAFTSCTKGDDPNPEPTEDDVKFNDFEFFQGFIVKTDSVGNFKERLYGEPLLENDSTILYVGVEDIYEARQLFCEWMPYKVEPYSNGPSADNYAAKLTDENYNYQGEVYFTTGEGDIVAEVSFSPELKPRHFSRIRFVLNSNWNGPVHEPVIRLGDIVQFEVPSGDSAVKGIYRTVCIRESGNGKRALCISLSKKHDKRANFADGNNYSLLPKEEEALMIHRMLKKNMAIFIERYQLTGEASFNLDADYWIWHWNNLAPRCINYNTGKFSSMWAWTTKWAVLPFYAE